MNTATDCWQVGSEPPPGYREWCEQRRLLFASPRWQPALHALGLGHCYAWNAAQALGALLPLRRQAGLRGGVLGFPVVNEAFQALPPARIEHEARRIAAAAGVDLLRVNYSTKEIPPAQASAWRPEVWLDDVRAALPLGKRLRKDLALARRAPLGLSVAAATAADVAPIFALYETTVRSHGGRLNYSADYFHALIAIAAEFAQLRVHCARGAGGSVHGFAVSAVDGETGFYLHGGSDVQGRRSGVSDLLLEQVLLHVHSAGCARLSLMSSPWDQPGLVRFKAKWGNRTGYAATTDIAASLGGRLARLYTRWQSRSDRRHRLGDDALESV